MLSRGGGSTALNRGAPKGAGTSGRLRSATAEIQAEGEVISAGSICTHFPEKVAFALVSKDS